MRTSISLAVAACVAGLSLAAISTPASADPGSQIFTLSCDDGHTYDITTGPGHGAWTPGFDSAGTSVFIPLEFGAVSGAAYLASDYPGGEPLFEFDDPSVNVKPAQARGLTTLSCTFDQIATEYDPEVGADVTFVATGDVTVGVRR